MKCEEKLCYIDESLNIEFGLIGEEMPDQCGEIVLPGKPCTAYCRKGYGINPVIGVEINISTSVSCEKGELQQDVKCTPLPCRELKIENAICSDPNCSMPTCGASQHNAECFFECNENFVQTNGKPAVCHLGLWINETECKDKTCDAIEESGIAQNNCAGTKHGNRCSVKCESGYRLASKIPQKMNALCHHGNWLDLPRCISKALYQPFPDTEVFHGGEISPLADADYITEIAAKNDSAIAFSGKFNSSGYHRLDLDYFDTTDDSYTVIDATKLPLNKEIYLPQVLNESVHLTFWLNVSIGQASHSMLSVNRKNESGDEIAAGNMNNVFMMTDDNHKHIKPECLNLICIDLRAFEISPSTGVQHLDYESAKKVPNHCCGCEMAIQIVLNEIPDDVFSAQVVSRGSSVTLYSKKYEKITLAHPFPVVMTKKVVCQHFLKPEKIVFQPPSIENIIGNVEVRYRGELYVKNGDQTNVAEYVLEQDKA